MNTKSNLSDIQKVASITDVQVLRKPNKLKILLPSLGVSFYKKRLLSQLENIKHSQLSIHDPEGKTVIGQANSEGDLCASIHFKDLECYRDIALGGSNAAAEAFIQGRWQTDSLTNVICIMARNADLLDEMEQGISAVAAGVLKLWHSRNHNSKEGSKKNIAAHYDLGNDFFRLFLDDRMMYSSYIYEEGDDLHVASTRKLDTICQQLEINANDHVLEIGSGWGGFACHAAKTTGCKVTTITISKEQFLGATELVAKEKLQQQVEVKLQDYRDISEQYDKVVSIEMIEAVGHQYLDTYFETISTALKPKGQALIQAITLNDHRYEKSLKEVDFIKGYIFPGSFIPCVSVISEAAGKQALVMQNLLDIGLDYATTLKDWRERFFQNIDHVRAQGFDERFIRMWEFYLCYCEGGFLERSISDVQIHFRKA